MLAAKFRSGPSNDGIAIEEYLMRGRCLRFSAGALRMMVLISTEMKQQCAKMDYKPTNKY